jgi:hypothetical protein
MWKDTNTGERREGDTSTKVISKTKNCKRNEDRTDKLKEWVRNEKERR